MINEHISVFFEGQDDLINILATSICSICYNTKSFIDFYILDCGVGALNKKHLENLKERFNNFSITYISIDLKWFDGLQGYMGFVDCYSRLLIPELAKNVDRAIYLDTDVIALDDIKKLWNEDLEGHEVGLAVDIGYNDRFFNNATTNLGIAKNKILLNAGVILMDCKALRKNKVSEKWMEIAKKYNGKFKAICEEILTNYYDIGTYKLLDSRYNLSDRPNEVFNNFRNITNEYLKKEWKNAVIQHYSPAKPWKISRNPEGALLKNFNNFWFFLKMTPFFDSLNLLFINNNIDLYKNNNKKIIIKLFNFIPIINIKIKKNKKYYKLFGFITIFSIKNK